MMAVPSSLVSSEDDEENANENVSSHLLRTTPPTCSPHRVVILGAGFAGLSVAYHLLEYEKRQQQQQQSSTSATGAADAQQQQLWDITLVEARNRIGGRVHPCVWGEQDTATSSKAVVVDYGAQWLHEASAANPLRQVLDHDLHIPLLYQTLAGDQNGNAKTTSDTNNDEGGRRHQKDWIYDRTTGQPIPKSIYTMARRFFYKAIRPPPPAKEKTGARHDTSWQDLLDAALADPSATWHRLERGTSNADATHDNSPNTIVTPPPSSSPQLLFQAVIHYLAHRTECYEGGRLRELAVYENSETLYQHLGGPDERPVGGYHAVLEQLTERMGMMGASDSTRRSAPEEKAGDTTTPTTEYQHQQSCRLDLETVVETIDTSSAAVLENGGATTGAVRITCRRRASSHDLQDRTTTLSNTTTPTTSVQYTADTCVCTLPLGVLQQRKVQFEPDLPIEKWQALDRMGMGILDKVLLEFPALPSGTQPFWHPREWFAATDAQDIARVQNFVDCTVDFGPIGGGGPPILCMLVGGDAARRFDRQPVETISQTEEREILGSDDDDEALLLTDEQVVEEALVTLRNIFGADVVPTPVRTHVTRWLQDPYACGAYSFVQVGSCGMADFDEVIQPIGPLLFAGEHTSVNSHACVHGAWETGKREAERIIRVNIGVGEVGVGGSNAVAPHMQHVV